MRPKQKAPGSKPRSEAKTKQVQQAPTAVAGKRPAGPALPAAAHYELIETAAYLRAEKRGFEPGHELEDWVAAEAELEPLLRVRGASGTRRA